MQCRRLETPGWRLPVAGNWFQFRPLISGQWAVTGQSYALSYAPLLCTALFLGGLRGLVGLCGRDALEGKGPQRRFDRRLEEVAKGAVTVGYKCHGGWHSPSVALWRGGGGVPRPLPMHPCSVARTHASCRYLQIGWRQPTRDRQKNVEKMLHLQQSQQP